MAHTTNMTRAERLERLFDSPETVRWAKRQAARHDRRILERWDISDRLDEFCGPEPELIMFEPVDTNYIDPDEYINSCDGGYWDDVVDPGIWCNTCHGPCEYS